MSDATGLGAFEVSILEACERAGAVAGAPFVTSQRVLELIDDATGVGPAYAYEPLCDMARRWAVQLPLIDVNGNAGSPDFGPAHPRYTECRLTILGMAALAAERQATGPLPVGLINGDLRAGGNRPPLDPARVVRAIRSAPSSTDGQLAAIVGLPSFPGGCVVAGDATAFAGGLETELVLTARIEAIAPDRLIVSGLPPGSSTSELMEDIHAAVAHRAPRVIRDVNVAWSAGAAHLEIALVHGHDTDGALTLLQGVWGIRRVLAVRLRAPLGALIRAVAVGSPGDLATRLSVIERAVGS